MLKSMVKNLRNILQNEIDYTKDYSEIYSKISKKIDEISSEFMNKLDNKEKIEIEKYLRSKERNYYSLNEYVQNNVGYEELIYQNKDSKMHLIILGENKEIESILKYKLDIGEKPISIEDFIKTTDEGRKLIPESGDVSDVTLKDLNNAIEKENGNGFIFKRKSMQFARLNDNLTLSNLDKIRIEEKENLLGNTYIRKKQNDLEI